MYFITKSTSFQNKYFCIHLQRSLFPLIRHPYKTFLLTLTVLVMTIDAIDGTLLNRIMTTQWEGMGDVGSARYEFSEI